MSPPGSFYSGWSSGEDFQPLVVRVLFETALRMNSFTGSFIQTFMLRKWHARRVVVRGWMDGVGGGIPCIMIGLDEVARARGRARRKERSRWR